MKHSLSSIRRVLILRPTAATRLIIDRYYGAFQAETSHTEAVKTGFVVRSILKFCQFRSHTWAIFHQRNFLIPKLRFNHDKVCNHYTSSVGSLLCENEPVNESKLRELRLKHSRNRPKQCISY